MARGRVSWGEKHPTAPVSLEEWLENLSEDVSNAEITEQLQHLGVRGITYNAVKAKRLRLRQGKTEKRGSSKKELEGHISPEFPEFDEEGEAPEDFDWRSTVGLATSLQRARSAFEYSQTTPKPIHIDTTKPIAITFTADWHLGSGATDHELWKEDMEFFIDTPGLYSAIVGDEIDNFTSFRTLKAIVQQVLPVDIQRYVLEAVTREMVENKKLLFTTWGNHTDEFDERLLGQSLMAEFRRTQGAVHLGGLGIVRLKVGQEEYSIAATHKARFRSHLRTCHGAMKLYQQFFPADLCVIAHDHRPAHEEYNHYNIAREMGCNFGGTSWLIACSTYKLLEENDWGARMFGTPRLKRETAVLWPDQHRIEVFDSAEAAIDRANTAGV